jgi:GntR family transcriptional repressor for pyruvate dehydrogenase complex
MLSDNMKLPPKSTGARRVADELIRRIFSEQYPPGVRLPAEVELAEEFACGRSTIREALRHLSAMQLVQSRRGSGAVVLDYRREGGLQLLPAYFMHGQLHTPLPVLVKEMLRIRTMLACEAVRLAASYAKPAQLKLVREQIERTHGQRGDPERHALGELEVFRQMALSSELWPAVWLANDFIRPMRQVLALVAGPLAAVPPNWKPTMDAIMDAVERGDGDEAVAKMRGHFATVDKEISQALGALFPADEGRERK